jgi:hypothetical protein
MLDCMRHLRTAARIGAVVSSAALVAVYVSCQSRNGSGVRSGENGMHREMMPGSKLGRIEPYSATQPMLPGSKSSEVIKPSQQAEEQFNPTLFPTSKSASPLFPVPQNKETVLLPGPKSAPTFDASGKQLNSLFSEEAALTEEAPATQPAPSQAAQP